ncbi:hypothetical protein BRCON_1381 [Candidatus Sumerlaea chitinivorans]|uniref:Uncharacterized protein n=1 Tax=Sumerlaea chitinivorans TaxID=2250252 RepID=A0A2Z4Y5K6_SUMC1|nr:hypothetical protein BRCON_1381 [Candidatus Sumerlaea chitinivorans]
MIRKANGKPADVANDPRALADRGWIASGLQLRASLCEEIP